MADEKTPLITRKEKSPGDDPEMQAPDWIGLTRVELIPYATNPFWIRVRTTLFYSFWLTLLALMTAALVLCTRSVRCSEPDWWREGTVYGVLTPSFKDLDNSGVGDLTGIQSKLDYLADLGIKTIWLSPIYKSPMVDFGYDVEDFQDIDEKFGTMEDFKSLVEAMKSRNLKLVMDFVPNHSSDKHEWFLRSVAREDPYTDYYVWASPKGYEDGKPLPPNNWVSVFGGSAWEWSDVRGQFYLHQFLKEQPDLNYRNDRVIQEMLEVIQFWLRLGVDGFRVDAVPHLLEDEEFRDEPSSREVGVALEDYNSLDHIHTHSLPGVLDILAQFRQMMDEYSSSTDNVRRLMMAEAYTKLETTMDYYGDAKRPLADFPFNFLLVTNLDKESTAQDVKDTVDQWMKSMPQDKWANWVLGNHDKGRVATRFGPELVDGLNMLLMLLPGTAVTYYGEEIGMEDTPIPWNRTVDPAALRVGPQNFVKHSRDPPRTPMQWNGCKNAGFSDADSTWLPVNPNYLTVNVEAQSKGHSHLAVYKALVRARSTAAIMHGELDTRVVNNTVFAFTRTQLGMTSYAVAINWGNETVNADLSIFESISKTAEVYITSINYSATERKTIETNAIILGPKEGIVLMYKSERLKNKND